MALQDLIKSWFSRPFFGMRGIAHNRNVAVAGEATEHVTWTEAEKVYEVTVRCFQTTDEVRQSDTGSLVVANAPTETIADSWLADAGGGAQDVLYDGILEGESLLIQRTTPITRISILSNDSARRFVISAVGVEL